MTPIPSTPYNVLGMRALALHKQGMAWKAIGDLLSEDPARVFHAARRMAVRLTAVSHKPVKSAGQAPQHALTRLIRSRGMTVLELCERTGIPEHAIYDRIRGRCRTSFATIARIAHVLDVNPFDVLATLPEGQLLDVVPTPPPQIKMPRSATPRGRQAYDLYVSGHRWIDISRMLGLAINGADTYARTYAKRHNLPWPPKPTTVKVTQ